MTDYQQRSATTHPEIASQSEAGSFVTGFTVGLFAGAAGYFLFATKRGKTLRQKIESEWQDAQAHLLTKGSIEESTTNLRDAIGSWWREYVTQPKEKKPTTSVKKQRKPVPKKFKGV